MHLKKEGDIKMLGIIRRIDSLGRIVLPKEVRQKLLIKPGDLLDISLYDEDSIIIRKNFEFEYDKANMTRLIKLISKKLSCNVFIINSNRVLYSSKLEYNNYIAQDDIRVKFLNNKVINYMLSQNYIIGNNNITKSIIVNGDYLAHIVFEFSDNANINLDIVNFLYEFLCDAIDL